MSLGLCPDPLGDRAYTALLDPIAGLREKGREGKVKEEEEGEGQEYGAVKGRREGGLVSVIKGILAHLIT